MYKTAPPEIRNKSRDLQPEFNRFKVMDDLQIVSKYPTRSSQICHTNIMFDINSSILYVMMLTKYIGI